MIGLAGLDFVGRFKQAGKAQRLFALDLLGLGLIIKGTHAAITQVSQAVQLRQLERSALSEMTVEEPIHEPQPPAIGQGIRKWPMQATK